MIGIKIYDQSLNLIEFFEPWLTDTSLISLNYSEFLEGIWNARLTIPTQSNMLQLFDWCNIIELVDFPSEDVLWRGFWKPSLIWVNVSEISLTQMKSKLSQVPITSTWTVTSVLDALNIIWMPYDLNLPNITIEEVEYRLGMNVYTFLTEVRKVSWYDFDYDGQTITMWRLWVDRWDIWFTNSDRIVQCSNNPNIAITNIRLIPTLATESVFAYNRDWLFYSTWDWCNNTIINSDATTVAWLQLVANNTLANNQAWYALVFDVPSSNWYIINIWDRIDLSVVWLWEPFDTDSYVYVLKKEGKLDWCDITERIYVSETIVPIPDSEYDSAFNIVNWLYNRVKRLETL